MAYIGLGVFSIFLEKLRCCHRQGSYLNLIQVATWINLILRQLSTIIFKNILPLVNLTGQPLLLMDQTHWTTTSWIISSFSVTPLKVQKKHLHHTMNLQKSDLKLCSSYASKCIKCIIDMLQLAKRDTGVLNMVEEDKANRLYTPPSIWLSLMNTISTALKNKKRRWIQF